MPRQPEDSGPKTAWSVASSTPATLTIVDVVSSSGQVLWQRLGDAGGRPLYTYDTDTVSGKSFCIGECAKEFPPLVAETSAVASGDWRVVTRDDGAKQWAYQGKPLHLFAGQDPPEARSDGSPLGGSKPRDPALFDPGSKRYSPKEGWKRAAFTPDATMSIPAGIALRSHAVANGYVFSNANTGMIIYALPKAPQKEDAAQWLPVDAPGLAVPMGDFSLVTRREDGKRQWAYKDYLLYTFRGDYSPTDMNGLAADKNAHPALAYSNFMPDAVDVKFVAMRGPVMMTKEGLALYTQLGYRLQYGGRLSRDGYSYSYADAKHVGTRGCVDACLKKWHPLLAATNAQPAGFWEIDIRADDGSRQWAYKGAPLYTYAGDKQAGDLAGNNQYEVVYGDIDGKVDLSLTTGGDSEGSDRAGSSFFWRTAALVN
jgi:predicted lipoprotein with Yx(FWY)xxD motif